MGKLVQFQRGIATVTPKLVRARDSQIASQRRCFNCPRSTDLNSEYMIKLHQPLARGTLSSALALTTVASTVSAATISELEPIIVSALHAPQASSNVTSAVTALDTNDLIGRGIYQLRDALNEAPGVIATSTAGQNGAVGTLLIRGSTTGESLIVMDGIRVNGSGNEAGNFFAASRSFSIGTLEVLRGPQSAIYGGESIGGVVWMETPRGSGDPSGSLHFEAGSFNSLSSYGKFQGQADQLSYFLSLGYEESDNDARFPNHFHQSSSALRVEAELNDTWTLGLTHRMTDSRYEGGYEFGGYIPTIDHYDSSLTTIYASGRISDVLTSRYTFGFFREAYDNDDASLGHYYADLDAISLSTDQEVRLSDTLRLVTGTFLHLDDYQSASSFSSVDEDTERYGAYTALEWDQSEQFTHTAALRWEDYNSHGDEITWRLGSVWRVPNSGTALRASAGTAFRAPSYTDLYYNGFFGAGNPNLESQTSFGWEVGIDQKIGYNHQVDLTYFRNLIENQINSFAFPNPVNVPGTSVTEGVELGWRGELEHLPVSYRLAWTHLHQSLENQPRNALTASTQWQATEKLMFGIGASHLSDRAYGANQIASYTIARVYGSYQLTEKMKFFTRVENVLDEDYELYLSQGGGFRDLKEGAGMGVYSGLSIDW